jgi:hypothetical protein
MSRKNIIVAFTLIGGTIGGYVPLLWGANFMSMAGVLWSALGGIAGIWLGLKLTR